MKTTRLRILAASMVVAFGPFAYAATPAASIADQPVTQLNTTAENKGQTQVATKIASSFGTLAGSDANTLKLVQALRNGTAVTLTTSTTGTGTGTGGTGTGTGSGAATSTTTTITPPTGKMGWGNVFISLALAKDSLARAGITNPTNAQLQAALMGGDVTGTDGKTVTLKGVLQMRADGMGWGQIAQASGTKLGPVVSSIKSTHKNVAALPAGSGTTTTAAGATASTKSSAKGVTTAAGASGASAKGNEGSKGMVTAAGGSASGVTHGNSASAGGKGVVTAAGGSAGTTVTHGNSANAPGQGAGVVNAAGGSAAGVTSAAGNAGGNGKGNGGGNGKGKGGG
jgi:hypothetical protein